MTHALRAFGYRFTTSGSEGERLGALLAPLRDRPNGPRGGPGDRHVEARVDGDVGIDRRGDRYAITLDGQVVGWVLPPGTPTPTRENLQAPTAIPGSQSLELEGRILG